MHGRDLDSSIDAHALDIGAMVGVGPPGGQVTGPVVMWWSEKREVRKIRRIK